MLLAVIIIVTLLLTYYFNPLINFTQLHTEHTPAFLILFWIKKGTWTSLLDNCWPCVTAYFNVSFQQDTESVLILYVYARRCGRRYRSWLQAPSSVQAPGLGLALSEYCESNVPSKQRPSARFARCVEQGLLLSVHNFCVMTRAGVKT